MKPETWKQPVSLALLVMTAWLAGCGNGTQTLPPPEPTGTGWRGTALADPTGTGPATPEEAAPSPSPTPPPWEGYAGPSQPAETAIPAPLDGLDLPEEVRSALLLGSDTEAGMQGRTDTMVLLLYNPGLAKASLISIPRDLLVYLPGTGMERINRATEIGGMELLLLAMEYNFHVRPENWLLVHLEEFGHFVDDLGGVNLNAANPVVDEWCNIPAGEQHLNGYEALCYVRSRTGSDDLDRNRRQQEMLRALGRKLLAGGNLGHLAEWYEKYRASMETNLELGDLVGLLPLALEFGDEDRLHGAQIGWGQVVPWTTPGGMAVLLPEREALLRLLQREVDFVMAPMPRSGLAATLEAELTATATATETPTASETPTPTP